MMTRLLLLSATLLSAATTYAADRAQCPINHHVRAGQPTCVHRFAIPTKTPRYCGGIVGGGAALGGGEPYVSEGTWGWDYTGFITKRVFLNWSHEQREASGGKYDTERRKQR